MVLINVLQEGSLHCFAVRRVGFPAVVFDVDIGRPTLLRRRFLAHSPAWVHLWEVSLRWSRQKVWWHDRQRKGRKSSWRQYSSSQCAPMESRSLSCMAVYVASVPSAGPEGGVEVDMFGEGDGESGLYGGDGE